MIVNKFLIFILLLIPIYAFAQDGNWMEKPDTIFDDDNIQRFIVSSPDSFAVMLRGNNIICWEFYYEPKYFPPSDSFVIKVDVAKDSFRINGTGVFPRKYANKFYNDYIIGFWNYTYCPKDTDDYEASSNNKGYIYSGKSVGFYIIKGEIKVDSLEINTAGVPLDIQANMYKFNLARQMEETQIQYMEKIGQSLPVVPDPKLKIKVTPLPDMK